MIVIFLTIIISLALAEKIKNKNLAQVRSLASPMTRDRFSLKRAEFDA